MFEDENDEDLNITEEEIKRIGACNEDVAKKFVRLMDATKDGKICYGEFRTYVRSHMVRLYLERDCAPKVENQVEEVQCFKKELIKRVEEFHTPIWMSVSDLDMIFLFEKLDKSKNGKISVDKDLVKSRHWSKDTADKMVKEMVKDGRVVDPDINLEEFNEYVDWPNIVYGIGDCLGYRRGADRLSCYSEELMKNTELMFDKTRVTEFFNFYDKDGCGVITRNDVEDKGLTGEDLQNFVNEMGMGDDTITYDEFKWYIRQQELSNIYKDCKIVPEDMHKVLLGYINNTVTEYVTQQLFRALDPGGSDEIEASDFCADNNVILGLLQRMDVLDDKDSMVNFVEFWLYLHTPKRKPRKLRLEKECVDKRKEKPKKIDCYKSELLIVKS